MAEYKITYPVYIQQNTRMKETGDQVLIRLCQSSPFASIFSEKSKIETKPCTTQKNALYSDKVFGLLSSRLTMLYHLFLVFLGDCKFYA